MRPFQRALRGLPAVVLVTTATACSWTRDYPEAWAPLPAARSSDCAAIAGSYANSGEAGGWERPLLVRYLFDGYLQFAQASHVLLVASPDGAWEAVALKDGQRLTSRVFTAGSQARCENGVLVIEGPWEWAGYGSGGIARVDFTTRFQASSEHLVAQVREHARGIAGIVPIGFKLGRWYRFPRRAD